MRTPCVRKIEIPCFRFKSTCLNMFHLDTFLSDRSHHETSASARPMSTHAKFTMQQDIPYATWHSKPVNHAFDIAWLECRRPWNSSWATGKALCNIMHRGSFLVDMYEMRLRLSVQILKQCSTFWILIWSIDVMKDNPKKGYMHWFV